MTNKKIGREEARRLLLAQRTPIVEKCKGCDRIEEDGKLCSAYLFPNKQWRLGICGLATHVVDRVEGKQDKVRIGQQKTKKHRVKK